ncbi:MAG: hypothetical protein IJ661_06710 [Lachnospiraceae bacterium]|nr:hypothetical protein [Lachnospiraceae bacterium]
MKKLLSFITLLFIVLIYHNEVIIGVKNGLLLWYQSLIPALLPFIIITNALSETHSYDIIALRLQNKINNIYILIAILLGNLCGYPIGAKIINDFTESGHITPHKANSYLASASQASPMFLLGFVYPMLPSDIIPVHIFFLFIYLPVILLSLVLQLSENDTLGSTRHSHFSSPCKYGNHTDLCASPSETKPHHTTCSHQEKDSMDAACNVSESFLHATCIMVIIGIYVIIFSVLLSILIPHASTTTSKCMLSMLEITTGLKLLNSLHLSTRAYVCLILFLSSFGGLSTAFQIKAVATYKNSSIKKYLRDKIILSAGTLILTYIYLTLKYI